MLFMARLSGCQCEQDLAIGAGAPLCQVAVDRSLGPFIGKMPAPPPQIGGGRRYCFGGQDSSLSP
jgi:hypothetical protein